MGPGITSWDVLNQIVGDNTTTSMTPYDCVASADRWPTMTADNSNKTLFENLSLVYDALKPVHETGINADFLINDYSTGGLNTKTYYYLKLIADLKQHHIPISGLGFQSHVGAKVGQFDYKSDLQNTFTSLAEFGLSAHITEFDCWIQDRSDESLRYQAAIYGDYMDACLYSSNCKEFAT